MPCHRLEDTVCFKHDRIMEIVKDFGSNTLSPNQRSLLSEIYKLSCEAKYSGIRMERRLKERQNHVRSLQDELLTRCGVEIDLSTLKISEG